MSYARNCEFSVLLGKTLVSATINGTNDEMDFVTGDGEKFRMYHSQDCCEDVSIEDVTGDLADLIGEPILEAEEVTSERPADKMPMPEYHESETWTFYKLGTRKGSVTIRWLGTSNGYYSEGVDFERVP